MQRGLALAAGGARGAYQAGVLLYLAEQGIQFDLVAGASIGALNGAFYTQGDGSAGHAEQLCELWRRLPDAEIVQLNGSAVAQALAILFARELPTVALLLNGIAGGSIAVLDPEPVSALLDEWIDYRAVCSSPRELVIAMLRETEPLLDIITAPWRQATYFSAKELRPSSLKSALLAAAAIPLAFPSQQVEGARYSDAGLVDPLPAGELYRRGARRIVSVFLEDDTIQNRTDYEQAILLQIRPSEIIDTGICSVFDFSRSSIERLIDLGYRDAETAIAEQQELVEKMLTLRKMGDINVTLADALPYRGFR